MSLSIAPSPLYVISAAPSPHYTWMCLNESSTVLMGLPRLIQVTRWSEHCQTPQGATMVMVRVTGSPASRGDDPSG